MNTQPFDWLYLITNRDPGVRQVAITIFSNLNLKEIGILKNLNRPFEEFIEKERETILNSYYQATFNFPMYYWNRMKWDSPYRGWSIELMTNELGVEIETTNVMKRTMLVKITGNIYDVQKCSQFLSADKR